jgi:hypothetical protein
MDRNIVDAPHLVLKCRGPIGPRHVQHARASVGIARAIDISQTTKLSIELAIGPCGHFVVGLLE